MYGVDKLYIPQTLEEALQILDRDPEVMLPVPSPSLQITRSSAAGFR